MYCITLAEVTPATSTDWGLQLAGLGCGASRCLPRILSSGLGGDGKPWCIGTEVYGDRDILPRDVISRKLSAPNAERIFFIRHALRAGFTIEEIFNLTKIDRWFLVQIKEIVDFEEELAGAKN